MKKVLFAVLFLLSLTAKADTFLTTNWYPYMDSSQMYLSNDIVRHYNQYSDHKFIVRAEGFARYKYQGNYYYNLFVVDCVGHTVTLYLQSGEFVRSEYINPSHPIWANRNKMC